MSVVVRRAKAKLLEEEISRSLERRDDPDNDDDDDNDTDNDNDNDNDNGNGNRHSQTQPPANTGTGATPTNTVSSNTVSSNTATGIITSTPFSSRTTDIVSSSAGSSSTATSSSTRDMGHHFVSSDESKSLPGPSVAGIVFATLVGLTVTVGLLVCLRRRYARKNRRESQIDLLANTPIPSTPPAPLAAAAASNNNNGNNGYNQMSQTNRNLYAPSTHGGSFEDSTGGLTTPTDGHGPASNNFAAAAATIGRSGARAREEGIRSPPSTASPHSTTSLNPLTRITTRGLDDPSIFNRDSAYTACGTYGYYGTGPHTPILNPPPLPSRPAPTSDDSKLLPSIHVPALLFDDHQNRNGSSVTLPPPY